jgi:AraC-like DNA-binding protein
MADLLCSIKETISRGGELAFSIYTSVHEQKLLNVPIAKPLLIVVISGDKALGNNNEISCHAGQFVFLSDSPAIDMRNIPRDNGYFAMLIEFDYEHFDEIPSGTADKPDYLIGDTSLALEHCLRQFVESNSWASEGIIASRKKEILMLLYQLGHTKIVSMMGKPKISHLIHDLFHDKRFGDVTIDYICERLAMSESTLRRKLKSEGTSVQDIKDRAKLGLGLHLLQTTTDPIGLVAEKCGYHSQSRFTDRFKGHFGLTPSELRKTKVTDKGENLSVLGLNEQPGQG